MTTIVELVLMALLAVTLVYCIMLERRLAALRLGQEALKTTIGELNGAITNAGAAMSALKAAASGAADTLDQRLARARATIDELSLLTEAGERIGGRIDRSAVQRMASSSPPPGGARLDPLRAVR